MGEGGQADRRGVYRVVAYGPEELGLKVLAVRLEASAQVMARGAGSIHDILQDEGLSAAVGLYFYRFEDLGEPRAFTKIGEVSRREGVSLRKGRGWLQSPTCADSYRPRSETGLVKEIYRDIQSISAQRPMYFVFYQLPVRQAFPKIDEIRAFAEHRRVFGVSTRNQERTNTFDDLGANLVWHPTAFDEVNRMIFPDGSAYPGR